MIQPDELKKNERLLWSTGTGTDVWKLFCAAMSGDVEGDRGAARQESVARALSVFLPWRRFYFAVRENQIAAAAFLLDRGADPIGLGGQRQPRRFARDRGYAEMEKLLKPGSPAFTACRPGANRWPRPSGSAISREVRNLLDASPELLHAGDNVRINPSTGR